MAIRLADTLEPMGDFPAVMGGDVNLVKADGVEKSLQKMYEDGDLGGEGSGTKNYDKLENAPVQFRTEEEETIPFTVDYDEQYEAHILIDDIDPTETVVMTENEVKEGIKKHFGVNVDIIKSITVNGATIDRADFKMVFQTDSANFAMMLLYNGSDDEPNPLMYIGINSLPIDPTDEESEYKRVYTIILSSPVTSSIELSFLTGGSYYYENPDYDNFFAKVGRKNYEQLEGLPVKGHEVNSSTYSHAVTYNEERGTRYWKDTVLFDDASPYNADLLSDWLKKHYDIDMQVLATVYVDTFYTRDTLEIVFNSIGYTVYFFSVYSLKKGIKICDFGWDNRHFFMETSLNANTISMSFNGNTYEVSPLYADFFERFKVKALNVTDNISSIRDGKVFTKVPDYTRDIDWTNVDWLGDGAEGGALAETYKVYSVNPTIHPVNIQKINNKDAVYILFDGVPLHLDIIKGSDEGYVKEGAGVWIYLDIFDRKETVINVQLSNTYSAEIVVYNKNGYESVDKYITVEEFRRKQDRLTLDDTPTEGSEKPVTSNGVYEALNEKQDSLTFDTAPTSGSANPVTSGGIYTALQTAGGITQRFTYVVNSDASLVYWLTNKKSGTSSGGSDFTSVLIRKGTWTYQSLLETETLGTIGTRIVVGEGGSIIYSNTSIRTKALLHDGTTTTEAHYIRGITIKQDITGGDAVPIVNNCANLRDCEFIYNVTTTQSISYKSLYALANCSNLQGCRVSLYCTSSSVSYASVYGFYNCRNLIGCENNVPSAFSSGTTVSANGYYGCERLTNCEAQGYSYSTGFSSCTKLSVCHVTGYTVQTAFSGCYSVHNCKVGNASNRYSACYASSTATSTYACADTPNGGFNS